MIVAHSSLSSTPYIKQNMHALTKNSTSKTVTTTIQQVKQEKPIYFAHFSTFLIFWCLQFCSNLPKYVWGQMIIINKQIAWKFNYIRNNAIFMEHVISHPWIEILVVKQLQQIYFATLFNILVRAILLQSNKYFAFNVY